MESEQKDEIYVVLLLGGNLFRQYEYIIVQVELLSFVLFILLFWFVFDCSYLTHIFIYNQLLYSFIDILVSPHSITFLLISFIAQ